MSRASVSVLLEPDWAAAALVDDVRRGLGAQPRTLPPKWLYDDAGSLLFDEITRLPEYYPTGAERAILAESAAEIAAACDATTIVELGSGTSDKTRLLLDAFAEAGRLERFVPVDVSEATLRDAAEQLAARYPGTETSPSISGTSPTTRASWSRSSAAPSATCTSRSARRSSARSATASTRATGCCSAPTWSRSPTA